MKLSDYPKIFYPRELNQVEGVYILHFTKPFKHAKHYVGYSKNIAKRLELHRTGQSGVVLLKELYRAGIGFECVLVYPGGTRELERYIKSTLKCTSRLCPICNPGRYRKELTTK